MIVRKLYERLNYIEDMTASYLLELSKVFRNLSYFSL